MIASVSAKPSHWIEVISSRISGWRVTDSITLPKMKPTPMPGPIVPRPAPTPSAMAWRPFCTLGWVAAVMTGSSTSMVGSSLSVGFGDGLAEVDGGEGGEDERLQRGDQHHLEQEEDDGQRQRHDADGGEAEQDDESAAHEQDEQVPGQDVREQPNRERDDPHELRDHLDHEQEGLKRSRGTGRYPAAQIAHESLRADALDLVAGPHHERERQRRGQVGRRGVDPEGWDLGPEDVDRLLAVRGQGDVPQ